MAPRVTLPIEERRRIVEETDVVTLNGRRAKIVGWTLDFAKVVCLPSGAKDNQGPLEAEFAWPTVKHILENRNGEFKA